MSRHGQGPTPPRWEGVLAIAARAAAILALAIAWVLPIQFSDAHHAAAAQEMAASGAARYPVLDVRQKVSYYYRGGWAVDAEVAEYRTVDGSSSVVRLHGYDQSEVVAERAGWFSMPGSSGSEVYVSSDGRFGMLASDHRVALRDEFHELYRLVDAWVAGWLFLGLGALIGRAASQVRRGASSVSQAALAPVLYIAVASALLAVAYGLSFPLARST